MSDLFDVGAEGVERLPLKSYTEKAYLDYSMYVILDRALPHVADGLKPVQRRIVYAMSELSLRSTAKHKKSARTVGDVIGKFHPHGDSAVYEAMVLMAQPFSYRYPLVDGQGNWGSPDDPKSFAAMRYTESRMSKFADALLSEIEQGTVDWVPNFDGTFEEPRLLPARVPHILLNGTTGIAVGMATDIPPHNLREVISACIHLLDAPKAQAADLMQFVKGPDYPTDAEIISAPEDLRKIYETGRGSVRMRAVYTVEDGDIVVTALPHQASPAKILEQIALQMQQKKLPMVADLRDESDHENPTRLVIEPRSNRIDTEALMNHLFATTDLEKSYRVNMNVIGLDGRPSVKNLPTMLTEWLEFRTDTTRRRLQFRLEKVLRRLHLLDGMLIAYLNLDEVIHIIRTEENPKQVLIERFALSEDQTEYILETKLRQLARLEEMKIRAEQDALAKERDELEAILGSERRLKTLIKKELLAAAEEYGDDRRSPIITRGEAKAFSEEELAPAEPVTVVLSEKGWIRAAKGHDIDPTTLSYKAGDVFAFAALGRSNQQVVLLDSTGRSYSLAAHTLPSARGQGEPVTGKLTPPSGAEFKGLLMSETEQFYLLASDAGYGFFAKFDDLLSKNRSGKAMLSLPEHAQVLKPMAAGDLEKALVVSVSNEGRLLAFPASELPVLPKGKGNKIMNIPSERLAKREEFMAGAVVMHPGDILQVFAGKRFLKLKVGDLEHYRGERGRRGSLLPKGFQNVDSLAVTNKE